MSQIDIEGIADQIRATGADTDKTARSEIPINIDPVTPEPNIWDEEYVESLEGDRLADVIKQRKADLDARPGSQERKELAKQNAADLAAGRRSRELHEFAQLEIEREQALGELYAAWDADDSPYTVWDEGTGQSLPTRQGLEAAWKLQDLGATREDLIETLGEDQVELIERARSAVSDHQQSQAATVAYSSARDEFERLADLGENHTYTERALEFADFALNPDNSEGLSLVGMGKEQGAAFALACYEVAYHEKVERENAEARLWGHIGQASADSDGNIRVDLETRAGRQEALDWFFGTFLPDLSAGRIEGGYPESVQRIMADIEPRDVDYRAILNPLSVPLEEALVSGNQKVIRAHTRDIGQRAAAAAGVPYHEPRTPKAWTDAMSKENRRLDAERSQPKPRDEVDMEAERKKRDRAAAKAFKKAALERSGQ